MRTGQVPEREEAAVGYASLSRHALIPILTLIFGLNLIRQAIVPAHAADATLVFAAYEAIIQHHVDRPDPVRLLAAALGGVQQALAGAGITAALISPATTDASIAKAEFQVQFDRAVGIARGKLKETGLQYAAARAMAASLHDNTRFYTPEEWAEFTGKGYVGIGFRVFRKDTRVYIEEVLPYTPAANAGLRRFDRILSVDGQDTTALLAKGIRNVQDHIMGRPGTKVGLVVRRPGQSAPLAFSITRQRIQNGIPALQRTMLAHGVGHVRVPALTENSAAEFRRALVDLQRQGLRGLVLDLRGNQGVKPLRIDADVASALLPEGVPVLIVVARDGRHPYVTSGATLLDPAVPLVVLIDARTVSGEVLSQAIREAGRGKLVGMPTAGETGGAAQVDLPGGAGIIVRDFNILSGGGTPFKNGVPPDVIVDLTVQDLDHGIDTQLQRAVQLLSH